MGYSNKTMATYMRQRRRARKDEYFADKVCLWCGSDQRLTLRYGGPEPVDLSTIWDWPQDRREDVLTHCVVLCRPHWHQAVQIAWRSSRPVIHGLSGSYQRGCQCAVCNQSKLAYIRYYRRMRRWLKGVGIMIPLAVPDPFRSTHNVGCPDPDGPPSE